MNNLPFQRIGEETADRNAMLSVSLSFLLVMLPHFAHSPLWVSAFTLFALIWRSAQAFGKVRPIPRWLLVPMVIAGGLGVFAQYWTIVGRDPGLALLSVMTAFKFLEARSHRDLLILIFLCYFLLATHFLFGQTILIALYMLLVLIVITSTLMTLNQRDDSVPLKTRLINAAKLIGLAIPMMILLFILVPRIPGPLWGFTSEQRGGVTGLSDSMSPGTINNLINSNEVAFRVKFDGPIPPQSRLYWRGPVMANFDGRRWTQARVRRIRPPAIAKSASTLDYTITLEANGQKWLLGLDLPISTPGGSNMSAEYLLSSDKPVIDLKRYHLRSLLKYRLNPQEDLDYLRKTEQFPAHSNPKTLALGRKWARQFKSGRAIINQALTMFRRQNFIYTLQPPRLGKDSSDEFLFQTRKGFCEHYASSFALLMRAAGLPARIVTGYQGGEINQLGDYLIVRQSDAHAWTEVWLDNEGWVRFDPTAAVSPDRIEKGLDSALPEGLANFKIGQRSALVSQLLYRWDNLQNRWNSLILNYDGKKQNRFLRSLGIGIRDWGDMIIALVVSLAAISGLYILIGWYRQRPDAAPEYEQIIQSLLRKLERQGFNKRSDEDVYEFLQRIKRERHYADSELDRIFSTYSKIKYAHGYQQAVIIKRFRKMVLAWKVKPADQGAGSESSIKNLI